MSLPPAINKKQSNEDEPESRDPPALRRGQKRAVISALDAAAASSWFSSLPTSTSNKAEKTKIGLPTHYYYGRRRIIPPPPPSKNESDAVPEQQQQQQQRPISLCTHQGCASASFAGGILCVIHNGAARKNQRCRIAGCSNASASAAGTGSGLCSLHGARPKRCCAANRGGCDNGVAARDDGDGSRREHGAESSERCSVAGCANFKIRGGLCRRHHGAGLGRFVCRHPGCTIWAERGLRCSTHARTIAAAIATTKCQKCSVEGCSNFAVSTGLCYQHGAVPKPRGSAKEAGSGGGGGSRAAKATGEDVPRGANAKEPEWDDSSESEDKEGPAPEKCTGGRDSLAARPQRGGGGGPTDEDSKEEKPAPEKCESESDSELEDERPDVKRRRGRRGGGRPTADDHEGERIAPEKCGPDYNSESEDEKPVVKKRRGRLPKAKPEPARAASVESKQNEASTKKRRFRRRPSTSYRDNDENGDVALKHRRDPLRPSRDVLGWIRSMPSDEQRKHVSVGMRVKVRFGDNVWYGGLIDSVLSLGHRIRISFDDGTEEESDFPDTDIVVDDRENGRHRADARAFTPRREESFSEETSEEEEEGGDASETKRNSSGGDDSYDTEEEEELGALIYRSSVTAQSIAGQDDDDGGGGVDADGRTNTSEQTE